MRTCRKCNDSKELEDFVKDRFSLLGRRHICKVCHNARTQRNWNKTTGERRRVRLARRCAWVKEYIKDPKRGKISHYLRSRLRNAMKGNYWGKSLKWLGCTIPQLRDHLERQFRPGMSWNNWSPSGWHIDHIRPLSKFDLNDPSQAAAACHYTNLQPLWAKENNAKYNKIAQQDARSRQSC